MPDYSSSHTGAQIDQAVDTVLAQREIIATPRHYYLDASNGDDGNDGLTMGTALQTIDAMWDLLCTKVVHAQVVVHMTEGNYALTDYPAKSPGTYVGALTFGDTSYPGIIFQAAEGATARNVVLERFAHSWPIDTPLCFHNMAINLVEIQTGIVYFGLANAATNWGSDSHVYWISHGGNSFANAALYSKTTAYFMGVHHFDQATAMDSWVFTQDQCYINIATNQIELDQNVTISDVIKGDQGSIINAMTYAYFNSLVANGFTLTGNILTGNGMIVTVEDHMVSSFEAAGATFDWEEIANCVINSDMGSPLLSRRPASSETPRGNGDLAIEATNDTTLTFKLKGSDGVVRTGVVSLS